MQTDYDVLIVGGGLVGAALATALQHTTLRLGLVEARPMVANTDADYNERSVALGFGSRRILEGLAVWNDIAPSAQPIHSVHVSEKGRLGVTRLKAEQQHLPALGYVVLNRQMGAVFAERLAQQENLEIIAPAKVEHIAANSDVATVTLLQDGQERIVTTRLLVGADGTGSFTRQQLGLALRKEEYCQSAVIANVSPQRPHEGVAYERFTPDGPVALLPLTDNRCALVWTQSPEQVEQTRALSDDQFLRALENHFGQRLGGFSRTGERHIYPLALHVAEPVTAQRSVVIGNAAHTLHPIAGQGLNLALRDVADLAELLVDADDPGTAEVLANYENVRQRDVSRTVAYTDTLLRLFTNPMPLLDHARGVGLMLMDRLPLLRGVMARQGMGFSHARSRLARGISLRGRGA